MEETWLHPNRRALFFGVVPYVLIVVVGLRLALSDFSGYLAVVTTTMGCALAGGGVCAILLLIAQCWKPRIAYANGMVLFYLRPGKPISTPVEIVEAFFLGSGPTFLKGSEHDKLQTVNLVARMSERASDWHHVEVNRLLGHWCDGYVTIRGTWCQSLDEELVQELNRRLSKAKCSWQPN